MCWQIWPVVSKGLVPLVQDTDTGEDGLLGTSLGS